MFILTGRGSRPLPVFPQGLERVMTSQRMRLDHGETKGHEVTLLSRDWSTSTNKYRCSSKQ